MVKNAYPETEAARMAGVTIRQLGYWKRELGLVSAVGEQPSDVHAGWGGARKPVFYSEEQLRFARFYAALLAAGATAGELKKKFGAGRYREVLEGLLPKAKEEIRGGDPMAVGTTFLAFGRSAKLPHVISVEARKTADGIGDYRAAPVDLAGMSAEELGKVLISIGQKLLRARDRRETVLLLKATVAAVGRGIEAGFEKASPGGRHPAGKKTRPRLSGKNRR